DDRDDAVSLQDAVVDELRELTGVGDGVDRDLANFDGVGHGATLLHRWDGDQSGTTTVPASPRTASPRWARSVMTARLPPASTNRHTASTFGPIEPLAKWPWPAYAR